MRTSGVVLDIYDDPTGVVLRSAFPTKDDVPEIVKSAHFLTPPEREVLRDEAFALILENEGKVLRKFACVDEGNTLLSALYLERTHEKLPTEAVKIAAANIIEAFERFSLPVPAFLKVAAKTGMGRKRDPMNQPYAGDEAEWAARTNLNSVQGSQPSGRVMESAAVLKTAGSKFQEAKQFNMHMYDKARVDEELREIARRKTKTASPLGLATGALGGAAMGSVGGAVIGAARAEPGSRLKGALKGGAIGAGVGAAGGAGATHAANKLGMGMPKTASVRRIDVSGLEPEVQVKQKTASRTALHGRYALDSFADVEAAVRYFDEHYVEMDPPDRHEYAMKTASRADELGIQTSALLDRYGGTGYAPDVDAHLASRRAIVQDPEVRGLYTELAEKRASIDPEQFAQALATLDEVAGLNWYWGGEVADPYFATFGGRGVEKQAGWSWNNGLGDSVNEAQLKELARSGRPVLEKTLSPDAVTAFQKNPIQIFESMPDPMKVILSRMATEVAGHLTLA